MGGGGLSALCFLSFLVNSYIGLFHIHSKVPFSYAFLFFFKHVVCVNQFRRNVFFSFFFFFPPFLFFFLPLADVVLTLVFASLKGGMSRGKKKKKKKKKKKFKKKKKKKEYTFLAIGIIMNSEYISPVFFF